MPVMETADHREGAHPPRPGPSWSYCQASHSKACSPQGTRL